MSEQLTVDVADSWAYRVDGSLQVVLHLPDCRLASGEVTLRLRSGSRVVRRSASVQEVERGVRLECELPARRLRHGVWRLALREPGASGFTRLEARVLSAPGQPVALLPGPAPATRMPPPARDRGGTGVTRSGPREAAAGTGAGRVVRRARRLAGRVRRARRSRPELVRGR